MIRLLQNGLIQSCPTPYLCMPIEVKEETVFEPFSRSRN